MYKRALRCIIAIFLLFSLFNVPFSSIVSLAGNISGNTWARILGTTNSDKAPFVLQTDNNGYIVTGDTYSSETNSYDLLITNLDKYGKTKNAKRYGGNGDEWISSLQKTSDGGYIIGCDTTSFGSGARDVLIVKFDSDSNYEWARTWGGNKDEWIHCIEETHDGGYIIGGMTLSFDAGYNDYFILKLGLLGTFEWAKTFKAVGDWAYVWHSNSTIQETKDNGFIIGAWIHNFTANNDDFLVLKLNSNGDFQWAKTFDGTNNDWAFSIKETKDGGYIVGGNSASFGTQYLDFNILILKLKANGDTDWAKTFGGISHEWASFLQETSDNGYIIVGETSSFGFGNLDCLIINLNSDGSIRWVNTFGGTGDDRAYCVQQIKDNGYIISGDTTSFGTASEDFLLLKLGSDGNLSGSCGNLQNWSIPNTSPGLISKNITISLSSQTVDTNLISVSEIPINVSKEQVICGSIITPPRNLVADSTQKDKIILKWDPSEESTFSIESFRIYRGTEQGFDKAIEIRSVDSSTLTYTDANVTPGITYYYYVTAIDIEGNESEPSNEACAEPISIINEKKPILLVHGFQLVSFHNFKISLHHPLGIWKEMIKLLSGRDVYKNKENGIYVNAVPLGVDKNYSWIFWKVPALNQNYYDVYVSDYSHWLLSNNDPNSDHLPTLRDIRLYAQNLKKEIQAVKMDSGVNKINIIAHSMGGLVARTYIENSDFDSDFAKLKYGFHQYPAKYENDIDTLILIGTPNHGTQMAKIYNSILKTAMTFAFKEDSEMLLALNEFLSKYCCGGQMETDSDFLKILNYGENKNFSINNNDQLNPNVKYITVGGVIPRYECSGLELIDKIKGVFNFSGSSVKKCYQDTLIDIIDKLISSPNKSDLVGFDDGMVPANSLRLYSQSGMVNNFHLHSDHSELIRFKNTKVKNTKDLKDLIKDLLDGKEVKKDLKDLIKDLLDGKEVNPPEYWSFYGDKRGADVFYRMQSIFIFSPVILEIDDTKGNILNILDPYNNQIPGSFCSLLNNQVQIFNQENDLFTYRLEGINKGSYGIGIVNTDFEDKKLNLFVIADALTNENQQDEYIIDWEKVKQGVNGAVIKKDFNGDGTFDETVLLSSNPSNLQGALDFDTACLSWNKAIQGTYPIRGYQIYRANMEDGTYQPLAFINNADLTNYNDTSGLLGKIYSYYVVAVDEKGNTSPSSNFVTIGPILQRPKPTLLLSPELNRNEYYPDDDVIIKMSIINKGNGDATNVKLTMTLPQDIEYVKADLLRGSVFGNTVEFNIGKIPAGDTTTFHIFCKVKSNIRNEKSVDIIFDVTCKENSTDRRAVHLLLKPKRGEVMPLSIAIYLKNTKTDPETGETYIDFDTPLELTVKIDGGSAPYTLKIDWGDGSSKEEKRNNGEEINLTHKFEARGSIEIKFEAIDAIGRSKKATVKMRVK